MPQAGSCASRRLASRLVPRFVPRFPHYVDQAASVLMALHQAKHASEHDDKAIVASTRSDALQGLSNVLEASMKLADKAVPTVLRIVDYLLK